MVERISLLSLLYFTSTGTWVLESMLLACIIYSNTQTLLVLYTLIALAQMIQNSTPFTLRKSFNMVPRSEHFDPISSLNLDTIPRIPQPNQQEVQQLIESYKEQIEENKDQPKQVFLCAELLEKLQKVSPNSSGVVWLYQTIGDLLWENSRLVAAIEFYKATFNASKILGIIEGLKEFECQELVKLGNYFMQQGFIRGRQFYVLALVRLKERWRLNKSEKDEVEGLINGVEDRRERVFGRLRERVESGCFVKIIQSPSEVIEDLDIKPRAYWTENDSLTRKKLQQIQRELEEIQEIEQSVAKSMLLQSE